MPPHLFGSIGKGHWRQRSVRLSNGMLRQHLQKVLFGRLIESLRLLDLAAQGSDRQAVSVLFVPVQHGLFLQVQQISFAAKQRRFVNQFTLCIEG